jgi:hypothetical protein
MGNEIKAKGLSDALGVAGSVCLWYNKIPMPVCNSFGRKEFFALAATWMNTWWIQSLSLPVGMCGGETGEPLWGEKSRTDSCRYQCRSASAL